MFSAFTTRLRARITGRGAGPIRGPRVLLYHRVFTPKRDSQLLCVSPENFSAQMRWLRSNCSVLSLGEMVLQGEAGRLPGNAVAVTFDDGYFDNLEFAAPALRDSDLPATVFVSSGFVESGREMWWDELEKILLDGEPESWNVTQPATTSAQRKYVQLCGELKSATPQERRATLDAMNGNASCRAEYRALTKSELGVLASDGLVEIGGHTINHVALSRMSPETQRTEIESDRAALENILGRAPSTFAYPFGTAADVDETTRTVARQAGYNVACANESGAVGPSTNRFSIPREIVRDWDVQLFAERMLGWLSA